MDVPKRIWMNKYFLDEHPEGLMTPEKFKIEYILYSRYKALADAAREAVEALISCHSCIFYDECVGILDHCKMADKLNAALAESEG